MDMMKLIEKWFKSFKELKTYFYLRHLLRTFDFIWKSICPVECYTKGSFCSSGVNILPTKIKREICEKQKKSKIKARKKTKIYILQTNFKNI